MDLNQKTHRKFDSNISNIVTLLSDSPPQRPLVQDPNCHEIDLAWESSSLAHPAILGPGDDTRLEGNGVEGLIGFRITRVLPSLQNQLLKLRNTIIPGPYQRKQK